MLLSGSNDGQLHAFDAGVFRGSCETSPLTNQQFVAGEFDNGSGLPEHGREGSSRRTPLPSPSRPCRTCYPTQR